MVNGDLARLRKAVEREPESGGNWAALARESRRTGFIDRSPDPLDYSSQILCHLRSTPSELPLAQLFFAACGFTIPESSEALVGQYWTRSERLIIEDGAAFDSASGLPVVLEIPGAAVRLSLIPPGAVLMGSTTLLDRALNSELPFVRREIRHPFWIGSLPITVRQADAFRRIDLPRLSPNLSPDCALSTVHWDEATQLCRELQLHAEGSGLRLPSGWGISLPSETQWEYACRGQEAEEPSGPLLDSLAWHLGNTGTTAPMAGSKASNSFGLFDMLGNVWEWVLDSGSDPHTTHHSEEPVGVPDSDQRVLKGGSSLNMALNSRPSRRIFRPQSVHVDNEWALARRDGLRIALNMRAMTFVDGPS
jgi:formylglycine-generating enzyme required for sulfatase activity